MIALDADVDVVMSGGVVVVVDGVVRDLVVVVEVADVDEIMVDVIC